MRCGKHRQPATSVLDEKEPLGVEPLLRDPLVEVMAGHPALLGVVGEGAGVDPQPRLLILTDDEMPGPEALGEADPGQRGGVGSQRPAHLPELTHYRVAVALGQRTGPIEVPVRPDSQGLAPGCLWVFEGRVFECRVVQGADQRGADAVPPV